MVLRLVVWLTCSLSEIGQGRYSRSNEFVPVDSRATVGLSQRCPVGVGFDESSLIRSSSRTIAQVSRSQ